MLRLGTPGDAVARWRRRAILRFGFLGALGLAATEIGSLVAPFIRVNRIEVVLRITDPKPLQLLHITESAQGQLIVDTKPLRVIDRTGEWDPSVIEISDSA